MLNSNIELMKNIGFGQFLVLLLLCFLLFGDFISSKKRLNRNFLEIKKYVTNRFRKKGS